MCYEIDFWLIFDLSLVKFVNIYQSESKIFSF